MLQVDSITVSNHVSANGRFDKQTLLDLIDKLLIFGTIIVSFEKKLE